MQKEKGIHPYEFDKPIEPEFSKSPPPQKNLTKILGNHTTHIKIFSYK